MYADYLKDEIDKSFREFSQKKNKYLAGFKGNLMEGIEYYKKLIPELKLDAGIHLDNFKKDLAKLEAAILELAVPEVVTAP